MQTAPKLLLFAAFGAEALQAFYDLRWMIVFAVILVIADFWFGVSDSLSRHKEFRFSRAGRRTCNKLIDYLAYLLVGCTVGLAIFEPLGLTSHTVSAAIGLGLGCLWELDSIIGHVCSIHGVDNKFSVKKFLVSLLAKKFKDVGESIDNAIEHDDRTVKK